MVVMTVFTGAAAAKSLYMVANHHTAQFDAWDIGAGCNATYQHKVNLAHASSPADIAVDESSRVLFITSEGGTTVEMVDATTMTSLGEIEITPPGSNNAGIEVDDANDIVYMMQRSSPTLYAFDWNSTVPSLTLIAGFPKTLAGGGYGIALDEIAGVLWVADNANGVARAYNTSTWTEVGSFAPSHDPVDIAVDRQRGFVYTVCSRNGVGGPGSRILSKYNLSTSTEATVDLGCYGVGVAVDEDTGCVYVTVCPNCRKLMVFTSDLAPTDVNTVSGSPAGICIPQEDIGYSPLNITKTDGLPDDACVNPDDTITYTICYDNLQNTQPMTNVTIVDHLDYNTTFVSASGTGLVGYDAVNHTVTWDIGDLAAGDPGDCVYLTVSVNPNTGGITLENYAKIGSEEMAGQVGVYEHTDVCYQPLIITKTDDVLDCVGRGMMTYTICYDNSANMEDVHNVVITDTLPDDVSFYWASGVGIYNPVTHTVTWSIGTVPGGAVSCVTLKVIAGGAEGSTLENCAEIDSDETDPTEACIDTLVCGPYPTPTDYEPVPVLTPAGMLALAGLLGIVGIGRIAKRRS